MRTSNPALNDQAFNRKPYHSTTYVGSMTMSGVVQKTLFLLLIVAVTATWTWGQFFKSGHNPQAITPWIIGGAIGGFVFALITTFRPSWSAITTPFYAALQGLFLGGITAFFELDYPGIALQAGMLSLGTLFAMLALYQSGLVQVTDKFRFGVIGATGALALVYVIAMALSFFGVHLSFIYGSSPISIVISLVIVGLAAVNLLVDFDFVERGARHGAPKYMEWYSGFALLVTILWLYVECIKLLAKLRQRNNS